MKKTLIKKSLFYNSFGMITYLFLQWLTTFVVVWVSGYNTVGIFSVAMTVSSIFYALAGFGMRNYQASDLKKEYSEKEYIVSRIITCIVALILTVIYSLFQGYDLMTILCINVYMVYKLSEALIDVLHGSMQKKWLYEKIGLSFIIRGICSIIVFTVVLKITSNLLLSIIAMTVVTYICVFLFDIKNYLNLIKVTSEFNKQKLIKLFCICLPLALYTFFSTYLVAYPKLQLGKLLGEKILGIYTTYANPAIIIQVSASFIFSPLVTLFAQLKEKKKQTEYNSLILKCFIGTILIGTIGYVFSYFFGNYFMKLLFGSTILKYDYLLCEIIIVSTLTALTWLCTSILTVMRNLKLVLLGSIIGFGISYALSTVFINKYNISGINYLLILIYLIMIIFYLTIIIINIKKQKSIGE